MNINWFLAPTGAQGVNIFSYLCGSIPSNKYLWPLGVLPVLLKHFCGSNEYEYSQCLFQLLKSCPKSTLPHFWEYLLLAKILYWDWYQPNISIWFITPKEQKWVLWEYSQSVYLCAYIYLWEYSSSVVLAMFGYTFCGYVWVHIFRLCLGTHFARRDTFPLSWRAAVHILTTRDNTCGHMW